MRCPAAAQLIDLVKFRGIEIPYTLKIEDKILKNPITASYYLRFKNKGRIICLVEGLRLDHRDQEITQTKDLAVPQKPRLKMKRNTKEKVFIFTVETGILSKTPDRLLRFEWEYVE